MNYPWTFCTFLTCTTKDMNRKVGFKVETLNFGLTPLLCCQSIAMPMSMVWLFCNCVVEYYRVRQLLALGRFAFITRRDYWWRSISRHHVMLERERSLEGEAAAANLYLYTGQHPHNTAPIHPSTHTHTHTHTPAFHTWKRIPGCAQSHRNSSLAQVLTVCVRCAEI